MTRWSSAFAASRGGRACGERAGRRACPLRRRRAVPTSPSAARPPARLVPGPPCPREPRPWRSLSPAAPRRPPCRRVRCRPTLQSGLQLVQLVVVSGQLARREVSLEQAVEQHEHPPAGQAEDLALEDGLLPALLVQASAQQMGQHYVVRLQFDLGGLALGLRAVLGPVGQ